MREKNEKRWKVRICFTKEFFLKDTGVMKALYCLLLASCIATVLALRHGARINPDNESLGALVSDLLYFCWKIIFSCFAI